MKLKAPKTWQIIVIVVAAIVIAIGGSFLGVYLSTGFEPPRTTPESIEIEDVSSKFNTATGQYETGENFSLKITTPTEAVTLKEITLKFATGTSQVYVDEAKTIISDGVIEIPEKVMLGQEFEVKLVKQAYIDSKQEEYITNKGGISKLVITTQNDLLPSENIQIAVDVPVHEVKLEAYDATADKLITGAVAQKTNFEIKPTFYPENSQYLYSDQLSTLAEAEWRTKKIFYSTDAEGISLIYETEKDDVYFSAADSTSDNNIITSYVFATAAEQIKFYQAATAAGLEGKPLYDEAIRVLSSSETAIKNTISIDVIEANVGSFTIDQNEQAPHKITVNKPFILTAGAGGSMSDAKLNAQISDDSQGGGNDLSSMIKNIALRVDSITEREDSSSSKVDDSLLEIKGGNKIIVDEKEYIFINSNVKDLKNAYFEFSTNGQYNIVLEVVLLVEDESGQMQIFDKENRRLVHLYSQENEEKEISWDITNGIDLTIVYSGGKVIEAEFNRDLNDVSFVPKENVYQKRVFFAYTEAGALELDKFITTSNIGKGTYIINGESRTLYPLDGSRLKASGACDFKLMFATVRADAYGTPIMDLDERYILQKTSSFIDVHVTKTLQGFEELYVDMEGKENYFIEGENKFVIPTSAKEEFSLTLKLKEGDEELFEAEKGKLEYFVSSDAEGQNEVENVFDFSDAILDKNSKTVQVPFKLGNINIENERGQSYFIRVKYDNSITKDIYPVRIHVGENADYNESIVVYNQKPKSIENIKGLDGREFNVISTLNANGSSGVTIEDITEGKEKLPILTDVNEFNKLIHGTTDKPNTIIKDIYGREFKSEYTVSSSDTNYVSVSKEGELSFGTGKKDGVKVTVAAGSASYSFVINTDSIGVESVEVYNPETKETENITDLQNVKLSLSGSPNTSSKENENIIFLKSKGGNNGLLNVKVNDGKNYDPDQYDIYFTVGFLSGLNNRDDFFEIISINGGNTIPTESTAIESISINADFGTDVSIDFVAKNKAGTLNFNFTLKLTKTVPESTNTLNSINYGTQEDPIEGVRDMDKPENLTENEIAVYAGYKINLDEYLKNALIDWGNVYKDKPEVNIDIGGKSYGKITVEETAKDSGEYDAYMTFDDVELVTNTLNFTLFAFNNNSYAYSKQLSIRVVPNFQFGMKEVSLLEIAGGGDKGVKVSDYVTKQRVTTTEGNTIEDTKTFNNFKLQVENVENPNIEIVLDGQESYFRFKNAAPLNYNAGQTDKNLTIDILSTDGTSVVKQVSSSLKIGVEDQAIASAVGQGWLDNFVLYGGKEMPFVYQSETIFTKASFKNDPNSDLGLDVSLTPLGNKNLYKIGQAAGENKVTIMFIKNKAMEANEHLLLRFTNNKDSVIATYQMPIIYSTVGAKFATYGNINEDLKQVLENSTTSGYNLSAKVKGGETYGLIAPTQIDGKNIEFYNVTTGDKITHEILVVNNSTTSESTGTGMEKAYTITLNTKVYKIIYTANDGMVTLSTTEGEPVTSYSAKIGQVFIIDGINYRVSSIPTTENDTFVVDEVMVGNEGKITIIKKGQNPEEQTTETHTYEISLGNFGLYLSMFDGIKYLTGFNENDLKGENKQLSFELPQGYDNLLTLSSSNAESNIKYQIKISNVAVNEKIKAHFVIKHVSGAFSLSYNFVLEISNNAIIGDVVYPYGGDREFVTVEKDKTIDLNQTFDSTNAQGDAVGKTRFPIESEIGQTDKELDQITLNKYTTSIKSLTIDGVEIEKDKFASNGIFHVSIDEARGDESVVTHSLLALNTINSDKAKSITLTISRSYDGIYGGEKDYCFTINAGVLEYRMAFSDQTAENNYYNKETNTLNLTDKNVTINAVTRQYEPGTENGNDVDVNKIETTISHNLPNSFNVDFNYKNKTLTITKPDFVSANANYTISFIVEGQSIGLLNVFVPATVNATFNEKYENGITAGKTYDSSGTTDALIASLTEGFSVKGVKVTSIAKNGEKVKVEGPESYGLVTIDGNNNVIISPALETGYAFTLRFTYANTNGDKEGYVEKTYSIIPNITAQSKGSASVTSDQVSNLAANNFMNVIEGTSVTNLSLSANMKDPNLFQNYLVGEDTKQFHLITSDNSVEFKPNFVGSLLSTTVTFTFSYGNESGYNFSWSVVFTINIKPAIEEIEYNYPSPQGKDEHGNDLYLYDSEGNKYEMLEFGKTYEKFFESSAQFAASTNHRIRVKEANKSEFSNFTWGYVKNISIKYDDNVKDLITLENNTLTIKERGTNPSVVHAVISFEYKGVACSYNIYVTESVVNGDVKNTIHTKTESSGEGDTTYETFYPDRTSPKAVFGKDRLLEINVSTNATAGRIYYAYKSKDEKTPIISFKLKNTDRGKTIYVDWGKNDDISEYNEIKFSTYSNKDDPAFAWDTNLTFVRFAGRVEYYYTTISGRVRIDENKIEIVDPTSNIDSWPEGNTIGKEETTGIEYDSKTNLYTFTVGFNGGEEKHQVSVKMKQALDIQVEREFNANAPTFIEIETNKEGFYTFVDVAGVTHPSTGEKINQTSITNGGANLSVEVVAAKDANTEYNKVTFVDYLNGKPYILTSQIGQANNPYDFYIWALGCKNQGDYVMMKFTYSASGINEEFYVAFHIVPGYSVSIAGNTVAKPGETNETANNLKNPYRFTPDPKNNATFTLASQNINDPNQLISFKRPNFNSSDIANSLTYSVTELPSGETYNEGKNLGKLDFNREYSKDKPAWTGKEENGLKTYTAKPVVGNIVDVTFKPGNVLFGEKYYKVDIVNDYGYKIEFYFVLVPSENQTPEVYAGAGASSTSFTENANFDIGTVYDKMNIAKVTNEEGAETGEFTPTLQLNNVPTSTSSAIILQNINAWGYSVDPTKEMLSAGNIQTAFGDRLNAPSFHDVYIQSVSFKYDSDPSKDGYDVVETQRVVKIGLKSIEGATIEKPVESGGTITIEKSNGTTQNKETTNYKVSIVNKEEKTTLTLTEKITLSKLTETEYSFTKGSTTGYIKLNDKKQVVEIKLGDGVYTELKNPASLGQKFDWQGKDGVQVMVSTDLKSVDVSYSSEVTVSGDTATGTITDFDGEVMKFELTTIAHSGPSLATSADMKFRQLENDTLSDPLGDYRELGNTFTVPVMPGWIYGNGESVGVTISITLAYAPANGSPETCEVSYDATLFKDIQISNTKQVVYDAQAFKLSDYIQVSQKSGQGVTPTFYDDTLEVTVPKQSSIDLNITFKENDTGIKEVTKTIQNTNTSRKVTSYLSLSELFGKTLDINDKFTVTYNNSEADVRYAGKKISNKGEYPAPEQPPESSAPTEIAISKIENDTLYIEDAGLMKDKDLYEVNKSYIVQIDNYKGKGNFYLYKRSYKLAHRYSFLDNGLGQNQYLELNEYTDITPKEEEPKNGNEGSGTEPDKDNKPGTYTIAFANWAGGIKVAQINDAGIAEPGAYKVITEEGMSQFFKFVPRKDPNGKTNTTINADNQLTVYNYTVGAKQYIWIDIYVKASGGADTSGGADKVWEGNPYDKYLGSIAIVLV